MRLQLWSPHQSSPTLQTSTLKLTPPPTTPKGDLRTPSTLSMSHSLTTITRHTRTPDTQPTLIPDTQTTLIPDTQTSLIPDTQPTLIPGTNLTHDISRIHGTQHPQIPGFQVYRTG